ncbi:MAG: arginine repressor [Ignavibacteria bacterium]|nr:arginine repressor [Ignavibacteria bacterium]MBI3765286.1 arginine repressor [Ignavibacteriales bacterium]
MDKHARQFAIKEIISSKTVASQGELRHELKKRGFTVTQATLSRDLKELGVARVSTGESMKYVLQPTAEAQILRPLVGAQVMAINANESMIVVKTLPGSASVVGEFLDTLGNADIIGTIAGDNTLLVIPQSQKKTHHVLEFLKVKLIEEQ